MKRLFTFCIFCFVAVYMMFAQRMEWADGSSYTFTQSPIGNKDVSESAYQRYFDLYSSTLDPLEGIYDTEIGFAYLISGTSQPQVNKRSRKMVICKDGDYLFSKVLFDDGYTHNSEPFLIFKRIGNTNAYYLYERSNDDKGFLPKHSERFVLNDNGTFSLEFALNLAEIKALNTNIREAMNYSRNVSRFYSAIKIYPKQTSASDSPYDAWSGTGFALNNGYIATNFHVVDGATDIKVTGVQSDFTKEYNATVVAVDKINDLAIIKISDSKFAGFGKIPYKISTTTKDVGEEIFVLGYPLTSTMGEEIKLTTGIISSKTGFQGNVALYQISAPIQPGNSGGPLFDSNGNIIGVVNAKHQGAENVGYAIKSIYLKNLVESFSESSLLPSFNGVSTLSLPKKIKIERNFVFYIKCKP